MNNDRMKQTVVGIYDDRDKAKKAQQELLRSGFGDERVDISATNISNDNDHSSRTSGFFGSLFGSSDDARKHEEAARRGTVVTVHTTSMNDAERAAAILDKFGTIDVDDAKFRTGAGTASGTASNFNDRNITDKSIPVIEEDLQIGKREVTTGGVRLKSRIVERPVEETMRLREEHINVDRHKVDRPASQADLNTFKDSTIEARERAEVPVVNKEARVVEEINLHKDVSQHNETIRGTERRQDVDVEKIDPDKNLRKDSDRRNDSDRRFS